jgi:hypothetical protein
LALGGTTALALGILAILWIVLLALTFRHPDAPKVTRLLLFQALLIVTFILGYFFLAYVYKFNFNPLRVELGRTLTNDSTIYLGDIVPGLYDLDYIQRIDTDGKEEKLKEEWFAFYQYDVQVDEDRDRVRGPWGAAIYDYDQCRPPAILSYELVSIDYDYLGQDGAQVTVDKVIAYDDPLSAGEDRPEVIVSGRTGGAVTDVNFFRKTGIELSCLQRQQWQAAHPGEAFPNPLRYTNIGSFRGNYGVRRKGSTVTVINRAPFERSQITIRTDYRPMNGSYFEEGTQVLREPVEVSLNFGPARPDDIPNVYYPEKAVLAFYLNLGKDRDKLEEAEGYLSSSAQAAHDIKTDPFGLSTDASNPARARQKLARVLVQEIRYEPDVEAERLRKDRDVTVSVLGVNEKGQHDGNYRCEVTWTVIGVENAQALPYGCEWRLETYTSSCPAGTN